MVHRRARHTAGPSVRRDVLVHVEQALRFATDLNGGTVEHGGGGDTATCVATDTQNEDCQGDENTQS